MQFDALATACMSAELQAALCPGRIQGALLVDDNSLGLEVYAHGARHQLLLCAAPNTARAHLVEHKLRRGVEGETPLLLLVRKYLRDAALMAVTQPDPYERVLRFHCEHKEHGASTLLLELIGRQANLLLLRNDRHGEGRILECMHRHAPAQGAKDTPARHLLPGRLYVPPPAQEKLPPVDDGRPDYYERLAAVLNRPGKLAKVLVEAVGGLGPQAAREVAARAAGDPEAPATAANVLALVAALQALWEPLRTGRWQPGNLLVGDQVVGFAPYPAHEPGSFVPTATLSAAVAAYCAAPPGPREETVRAVPADPYAQARANAAAALRRARQGIERRLAGLAADEPAPGEAQRLRTSAEWLLALASQVEPHQAMLAVPLEEGSLEIPLDPNTPPVEQAQRMFRRAAKLERAEVFIPQRRAELQGDLALVDQLALDLQSAANQPEIATVQAELRAAGLIGAQASSPAPSGRGVQQMQARTPALQGGLLRLRSRQGLEIVVGRNARQNERVTFGEAHPEDLWLHARGVPGSHTIIRTGGQVADEATVRLAAQLAAYHSGARGERAVDVIVTRKRWVQRAPGGKLGQVLVKQEERVVTVPGEVPADLTGPAGQMR
ncbi:MAG: NFACT family protein [Caldilineaceae bacterium]